MRTRVVVDCTENVLSAQYTSAVDCYLPTYILYIIYLSARRIYDLYIILLLLPIIISAAIHLYSIYNNMPQQPRMSFITIVVRY